MKLRVRSGWLLMAGALLLLLLHRGSAAEDTGRRVALIVGNGKYRNMTPLTNPANDAQVIAERLKTLKFEVLVQTDLGRPDMEKLLEEFYRRARGAELALFFYAGHGIQVRDRSYLIPVDAKIPDDESGMYLQAVELDMIVQQMQRRSKVGLVLLDACRNNPGLDEKLPGATRDVFRDVRLSNVPRGTVLILYATSVGNKARDGVSGRKNSPFAEALLSSLGERVPVETMAKLVSRSVFLATGKQQQPEVQGALNEDVYLAGRCPAGMHLEGGVCLPDIKLGCPKGYQFQDEVGCVALVLQAAVTPQTPAAKVAAQVDTALSKQEPALRVSGDADSKAEAPKVITDSQIALIQKLIKISDDADPEKPGHMFRLAEFYSERSRYYNYRASELDGKIADAKLDRNAQKIAQLEAQQKDFEKLEMRWLLEAVKQYSEIANGPTYQYYGHMDQVLFYAGYGLSRLKKEGQARIFYKRLIKDYPGSPFLPQACLSFAEYFFENRELENALVFYNKVLQYKDSPVYGYAMYKKAWVYYNQTDFKNAQATFIDVIDFTTSPTRGKDRKGSSQLATEAKKDLVRTFSQIGEPEKAWSFFQKHGKEDAPMMMELLARFYTLQSKPADAAKIREALKTNHPGSTP